MVDREIKFKARYVTGGNIDDLKDYIVHGEQTLQVTSISLILALSCIFGFKIWSTDVKLAYLQSAAALKRAICTKNPALKV